MKKSEGAIRTDGKRLVQIFNDRFDEAHEVSLAFCRNGYQTTSVTIDLEMLSWVGDVVDEYNKSE